MMITQIELKREIALAFLDEEFSLQERKDCLDHFPFETFEILIPVSVFQSEEKIFEDFKQVAPDTISKEKLQELCKKHYKGNYHLKVINTERKTDCYLSSNMFNSSVLLFSFTIPKLLLAIPLTLENHFSEDDTKAGFGLLNVICSTVKAFNDPEIVKIEKDSILKNTSSSGKKKTKKTSNESSTNYIHTKKYCFTSQLEKNLNNKKRVYERNAGSWQVRGHFREYKEGKKVWIDSYIKGKGKLKRSNYKITS